MAHHWDVYYYGLVTMIYGVSRRRGTSTSYPVTENSTAITLPLQLGIQVDNGRKQNSCPR